MALTSDETTRLATLQSAYDALISGKNTVKFMAGGRMREWGQGDKVRLKAEIDVLIAKRDSTTSRTRGALRFRIR